MNATMLARKGVKSAALPLGFARARNLDDLVVLLYHRVGGASGEIDLPIEEFERQLDHLSARERVRLLDDALTSGGGGVVVTFDDGYRDFHDRVLPLLVRYRVPAVLYLATGLVASGPDAASDALTWTQLQEAISTGLVTVGAHTDSHVSLAAADAALARDEMSRSKELIEERLQASCDHFAYPFAVGSSAADRVARGLFRSAALDAWRTNRDGKVDPYRLGRVPILRSDGHLFFRAKVRGRLDGEALAYRALGRGPWKHL